jgi:hypothetical protein
VWSWNAIGKRKGAWKLAQKAPESEKGFLMNHLISDKLPRGDYANADPVTGQAAWFDLRVAIRKSDSVEDSVQPQFAPVATGGTEGNAALRYGAEFRRRTHKR